MSSEGKGVSFVQ